MRKQVAIVCIECGKIYSKDKSEYDRNLKLDRKSYCSLKCAGKHKTSHLDEWKGKLSPISVSDYKRGDELSPFRQFLTRCIQKSKASVNKKDVDVTIIYLKDLWDKQNGICPYTGFKMTLYKYKKQTAGITNASLDRIDSSKGYVMGNVQFVTQGANFLKHTLSHEEMVEICKQIARHWKID